MSASLSSVCLPSHSSLSHEGQYRVLHCAGTAALWARPLPTAPNAKAPLLDKLSGLKHGSLLFTNCDIFHLKQIFAQKGIVLGLNGLSDINGAVSDWGQESHPKSERSPCSVQKDTKRGKGIKTCMGCLTFFV